MFFITYVLKYTKKKIQMLQIPSYDYTHIHIIYLFLEY